MIEVAEANKYIDLALALCDGVQVPATKPGRIQEVRNKVGDKLLIISCGIGTQKFYNSENQGPEIGSAIKEGANYEIIGRSIYANKDLSPRDAAIKACQTILNIIENNKDEY